VFRCHSPAIPRTVWQQNIAEQTHVVFFTFFFDAVGVTPVTWKASRRASSSRSGI
jgi:hypothetical protein